VTRGGTPAAGALPRAALGEERRERRAVLLGRSAAAPVALALRTIAGIAAAVVALLPAALGRRPGRLGSHRAGAIAASGAEPAEPPPAR
jgi:hypothetical protein